MEEKKALIAMSGGVDSSVAAYLMKREGYMPVGVTMMLHDQDPASVYGTHSCCTPDDIEDARVVASTMGIPFHVVNFLDGFNEKIIDKFTLTYLRGETPNPCIDCNRYMKFGLLFDMADKEGCEKVVTGHYADIEEDETDHVFRLKRAKDRKKDQTYVLYFLEQSQLERLSFPVGRYEKDEIRSIAMQQSLIVASKHDSQDICFVPDGDYAGYIERNFDSEVKQKTGLAELPGKGEFLDTEGRLLGYHKGYFHYTIGQRKGLGISAPQPLYVVDIQPESNRVILGKNEELFTRTVKARDFHIISDLVPSEEKEYRVTGKVRYRAPDTPGTLKIYPDNTAVMVFDEPVRAVTPGQSLVIYDGEYCLGGGTIVI